MEKRQIDYDKINRKLVEKNLSISHLSDLRQVQNIDYSNKIQEYLETKMELDEAKLLNSELEIEFEQLMEINRKVCNELENTHNKCRAIENDISDIKKNIEKDKVDFCIRTEKLYKKYETMDEDYDPENIKKKISEHQQEISKLEEKIAWKESTIKSMQEAYANSSLDIPNCDGVFTGLYHIDSNILNANARKLKELENKYEELKLKNSV